MAHAAGNAERGAAWRAVLFIALASSVAASQESAAPPTDVGGARGLPRTWPTKDWPTGAPASYGLDPDSLARFDADLANGKYNLIDGFRVFRCGTEIVARKYAHDYAHIYEREARTKGPINARLTGPYNYFDTAWHPFYHGTDLHTMQSISKTVTSIIYGIAITRGDFKAPVNTPILRYFDATRVKNVDARKRRITIENLLMMTSGMTSKELDVPNESPANTFTQMEATDDWVQYAIDRPTVHEPGKTFEYSSADAMLLGHIFRTETGQDIDTYGERYLFAPLGMRHYWKHDYAGNVDTEGGLYLNEGDLAKIAYLYLNGGAWSGTRIVSESWVKRSIAPLVPMPETTEKALPPYTVFGERVYYGYLWWLVPVNRKFAWMATGNGGQFLLVFPDKSLIAVFTGWDLKKEGDVDDLINRLLPAVKSNACPGPERRN